MSSKSFPANTGSAWQLALKYAQSDNEYALKTARKIEIPWNRAVALGWVARYAPIGKMEALAREAMDAASEDDDPYGVVGASAWPVRALIERQRVDAVEPVISRLVLLSDQIEHPVSRLDGLFLLWQAVYPLGGEMRWRVQEKFVAACRAADSWKAGDRLAWAATILASDDAEEALGLVDILREGRLKRQARRRIEAGRTQRARIFFW